ncbi:hypothetical protein PIB30_033856 [Stylosanthes scabra]|uniref:Uncharacterized protein n=1 Tax=Stylosanthes scabra TaxID=79078 RepID=A0ABU6RCU2_9FABA|nr:hypothetical protein [Stylosanthes scabra]
MYALALKEKTSPKLLTSHSIDLLSNSIDWSFIPRGNDTHFTVVLLVRFGELAEIGAYQEAQRKIEIQLGLMIKLATLVIEHLTNSQPSNSGNLPSQPLSNPWGSIGIVFLCTNQEGRKDALLNEDDVESLHECLKEVEEENEAQVRKMLIKRWMTMIKSQTGWRLFIPLHLKQHLPKTDDQLGALGELLGKKEEDLVELDSRFNAYSEHLYKLQNNRAKISPIKKEGETGHWGGRTPPLVQPHDLKMAKFVATGDLARPCAQHGACARIMLPRGLHGATAPQA